MTIEYNLRAIVTENLLSSLADPACTADEAVALLRAAAPTVATDGLYSVLGQMTAARSEHAVVVGMGARWQPRAA